MPKKKRYVSAQESLKNAGYKHLLVHIPPKVKGAQNLSVEGKLVFFCCFLVK
jgi:hypothetical protein